MIQKENPSIFKEILPKIPFVILTKGTKVRRNKILISPSSAAGGGGGSFNAVTQLRSLCRFSSLFHVTCGTPKEMELMYLHLGTTRVMASKI